MYRRLLAACAAALALVGSVLLAQPGDRDRTETLSRHAAERLEALHSEADRLATEERTLLGDLRQLEVQREIRAAELRRARADVRAATAELTALDEQVVTLTAQADAALPDLHARLVTLYKLGRGQYARLLLSASDLRQFGQAVRLVSAMAEQDRQRVAEHQSRLAGLNEARAAARERQVRLEPMQSAAEQAQGAAEQAVAAHTALVNDIDTRRDLNAQFAGELLGAQQRLQTSLAGRSSTTAVLPIAPFKGALDWPTTGAISQRFGAVVAGRPPIGGIEIQGDDGATVRAVHDGTVAYADVFVGFGRLVIVDHGNQTFSLYGNLGEIAVERGAPIERGAQVGTIGLAGGNLAVLYFELRIDGRAVDPLQWLAKR